MTDVPVTDVLPTVTVTATGGQTVFSFPFLIQSAGQLEVIETADPTGTPVVTTLTETTDYVVSINTPPAVGGAITLTAGSYPTGATAGDQFTLRRDIPIERLTDFPFRGALSSGTLNTQLDTLYLIAQELERDIGRAFTLPAADPLASITIPAVADRQGNLLGFDSSSDADAIAVSAGLSTAIVTPFMETLLDDADAATGRATLGAADDTLVAKLAGDNTLTGETTLNGPLVLGDGSELTIATGLITPTGNNHTVDTEADAASDDLTDIITTNVPDGGILWLRAANGARTVVVKHSIPGADKIELDNDTDFIMDSTDKSILLQRRGTDWVELSRSYRVPPVFTETYVSSGQTITAAGALTLAHNLSSAPVLIATELVCQTAEHGYSIGDVLVGPNSYIEAAHFGISIVIDATNINVRYGAAAAVFDITNKTTGLGVGITPANWTMIVRAWA